MEPVTQMFCFKKLHLHNMAARLSSAKKPQSACEVYLLLPKMSVTWRANSPLRLV